MAIRIGAAGTPGNLTLNGVGISTDVNSGFALATGSFAGSVTKLYVGLLNGTGLGAPVDNADQVGTWDASLRVISNGALQAAQTFKLSVTFGGTNDTNTIAVAGTPLDVTNLGVISINGKFTANGVIYGTVNFASAGAGTLSGLIGQSGAVGIFASDTTATTDYVGGFVAAPAPVSTTCNADDTILRYANCDPVTDFAARLAEANRCYNNGGVVQTGGDCVTISACLARSMLAVYSQQQSRSVRQVIK